jgi:hypothetical protein
MAMATATHDGGSDLSMLGAMRLRSSLVAIVTCLGLAACGGSSHSSSTHTTAASATSSSQTSASTNPAGATTETDTFTVSGEGPAVTTTRTFSAPPEVPKTKTHKHSGGGGGHGGASAGAHVEANVSIAASGDISPPVVSVPSGVGVELHVTNHGSAAATVALSVPSHPSAHVVPGGRGTLETGGLKDGTYRITVNGTPRGQLMIGAQGGP